MCKSAVVFDLSRGSARARMLRMEAFPPGASLPHRGSIVGVEFRLEVALRLGPRFLFVLKWRAMRGPFLSVGREGGGMMFPMASMMVGCLDALLTARGEGLSGMLPQSGVKMSLKRGAMERLSASWPEILRFKRRQSAGFLDERSVLRYVNARVRSFGRGNSIDGFAHWSSLSSRKYGRPLGSLPMIWFQSRIPWSHGGVRLVRMDADAGKSCGVIGQPSSSS